MCNKLIMFLLWLFLGWLGIHRFYVGKWFSGLIWMFTGGLLGIGWFFDLFFLGTMVDIANVKNGMGQSSVIIMGRSTQRKKFQGSGCLAVIVIILLLGTIRSVYEYFNPTTSISSTSSISTHEDIKLPIVFDMPSILDMSLNDLAKNLGKPTITSKPTKLQLQLNPAFEYDAEYQKEDITFFFSYNQYGTITKYGLESTRKSNTKEYIMKSCNLDISSVKYSVKVNNWLNLSVAIQNGSPEIASIDIIKRQ